MLRRGTKFSDDYRVVCEDLLHYISVFYFSLAVFFEEIDTKTEKKFVYVFLWSEMRGEWSLHVCPITGFCEFVPFWESGVI